MQKISFYLVGFLFLSLVTRAQESPAGPSNPVSGKNMAATILKGMIFQDGSLSFGGAGAQSQLKTQTQTQPLISFQLNSRQCFSDREAGAWKQRLEIRFQQFPQDAQEAKTISGKASGTTGLITFTNLSSDTLHLSNVVPFGVGADDGTDRGRDHVYITGRGDHELSRAHLFLPGKLPVNVIVPDNAWELGYCSFPFFLPHAETNSSETHHSDQSYQETYQLAGLVRRDTKSLRKAARRRFETLLYPGGSVQYNWYVSVYAGEWQQALTGVFQKEMLYDVPAFDDSLFRRKDLEWVRHTYVLHMMMTWDKNYYDYTDHKFHLEEFLQNGKKWYGGDDIVAIWPTWPTLGLDQRNQFDLFHDLPGGTRQIRKLSDAFHKKGAKLFICYNPWDGGTRKENHFSGLSELIAQTAADGVVLDTQGGSSKELQDAADRVRKGVIMYSEGMAVPKDMSGIVSGRVHNALYYPPFLNLNKLIKPEFTIYRVAELYKEPIKREFAISFFNGYGTEVNIMPPGKPEWAEEQYKYLGRTTRILRENTLNFTSRGYTPLIPTTTDSIWVNQWERPEKTIYTIYSIRPAGYKGYLFEASPSDSFHFVDIWHHRLLKPFHQEGKWWLQASTQAFNGSDLGTNNEGEVDCITKLPVRIHAALDGDQLSINVKNTAGGPRNPGSQVTPGNPSSGQVLCIWAGNPDYSKEPLVLPATSQQLRLHKKFGHFEGKFVIQLMQDGILQDETIVEIAAGTFRRISEPEKTPFGTIPVLPAGGQGGMVLIPAGNFHFKATNGDEFIPYPKQDIDSNFSMNAYLMDRFPVTNADYKKFLDATHYHPADTANFLKHWKKGQIPVGMEKFPVVYISYEDARQYAHWAGKRLPTELEWQYAAQTPSLNEWPWQQTTPVTRKEEVVTESLTVKVIEGIDPSRCNLGNDSLYAVGKYPAGVNPYGLQDLVGCVWQLTDDLYMNGSYRYIILKGGSYFRPSGSWWYVQGGPRELHYRQFLLRVSPGFERNATVGFRCVKDVRPGF